MNQQIVYALGSVFKLLYESQMTEAEVKEQQKLIDTNKMKKEFSEEKKVKNDKPKQDTVEPDIDIKDTTPDIQKAESPKNDKQMPNIVKEEINIKIDNDTKKDKNNITYFAKIGQQDKYNSKNQKIDDVAAILQQDRANFHKYHKADSQDTDGGYFNTLKNRGKIKQMLQRGTISDTTRDAILNKNPYIQVIIYENKIDVVMASDQPK